MLALLTIPSVFLLVLIVLWYIHYFSYYKHLKVFPGPVPWPLIGNSFGRVKTPIDVLPALMDGQSAFGNVFRLVIGIRHAVMVSEPAFAEFLLTSNKLITKAEEYRSLHSWLGTGLLTSTGEKWRTHRKMLTPAFHFKILEQFIEVFHAASDILIKKLEKEIDKNSVNIYPYITLCALDIICESTMGTQVYAQEDAESDYTRSVKEMCRILAERTISPIKRFDFSYQFTSDYQKEKKALRILHGYTDSVIKRRRQELVDGKDQQKTEFGRKRRLAFLDLLLQSTINGESLSDLDIRQEVDTFMFEGHDTTASAMSFILFCLANHPDAQEKAITELRGIFGKYPTRQATYSDLLEMRYLEMVIKETLRLYPSVPFYGREVMEDIEYEGSILPKGTAVSIFAYGIGRNAEVFPEPEKFDPERFSSDSTLGRNPFSYLPFSAGFRNCIGQKFALLEMKSTVSKVLRNYKLYPSNPQHELMLSAEAVLKSANGVCVRLEKRSF